MMTKALDVLSMQVSDDAKLVLESYPDSYFDVIVLDLCDPLDYGPCYTLYAQEFYDMCFRKLTPAGMLCA
jgi:spermidine synthase